MNIKLLLAGLVVLPFAANADDFHYTFVDAGYINSSIDTGPANVDGDGFGVRGSYAFDETWHAFADYASENLDFGLDTTSYDVGVGGHWPIQTDLDFVTELAWVKTNVDTPVGSADDDGFGVNAGLRYRLGGKVELQGGVDYVNLSDSNTALDLGARYYLSEGFAVGGGLVVDNDDTAWNIGIRAEFGGR